MPLWVLVLFCFFLGAFTASLYGIYEVIVQRQTIRQLKHNLEILASELKQAGVAAEGCGRFRRSPGPPPEPSDCLGAQASREDLSP